MKKTSIPGISFVASPDFEKLRIAYTSSILVSGFFKRREYLITPELIHAYKRRCVVLPDWIGWVTRDFWVDAKEGAKIMPIELTERMKKEIESNVVEVVPFSRVESIRSEWNEIRDRFWEALIDLIPDRVRWLKTIEVRVTNYGTYASHYLLERRRGQHLVINLRTDADIYELGRMIILAILWPDRDKYSLSWSRRMVVANYLMSTRKLVEIFGTHNSILEKTPIPLSWQVKSNEYITKLNIPMDTGILDKVKSNMHVFGSKESSLLLYLINNSDELVDYDKIADLLWGVEEFVSYEAITKMVQRIRKKLDKINVDVTKLRSVKGRGYMWKE